MMNREVDCLVVGAGPAGCSAARRLALSGRSVLVLERASLGHSKCCAGGLTPKVNALLDFDLKPVVEQEVEQGSFSYRNASPLCPSTPSLGLKMVRRDRFDSLLAERARAAGAEVWERADLLGLEVQRNRIEARTARGTVRAPVVVGADGALSRVARWSGLWRERKLAIALAREIPLPPERPDLCARVLFDFGALGWGYRWSFPKGDRLSVGLFTVGTRGKALKSLLVGFPEPEKSPGSIDAFPLRGHPLPCFGVYEPLCGERVVLCGDAAGLVDPLTGEGIAQAIESGLVAADAIRDFLAGRGDLSRYARTIQETLGQELFYAHRIARFVYGHPYAFYRLLGLHQGTASLLARVMRGELSYRDLYRKLKGHPLGQLYSLTKGMTEKIFGGGEPFLRG